MNSNKINNLVFFNSDANKNDFKVCVFYKDGSNKIVSYNEGIRLIKEIADENNITTVAFEDIQMQASVGNNVKTFKVLANVYGVILELCEELQLKYKIVSSNT